MRIAIVGAGWAGTEHAKAYAAMEDVEIAAVVATSETRAKPLAAEVESVATTDLAAVLRDDAIDAVDVCVPSGLHRGIAVPALEAGKHVFLETPMSLTLEDADAMLDAAKASGCTLAVAQLYRFVAPYAAIHRAVAAGDLGPVRFVSAAHLFPLARPSDPPRDYATYGDPMVELMIFEYEYLQWLLGPPRSVVAAGRADPAGAVEHAVVTLVYDGAVAAVEGSVTMPRSHPATTSLRVQGEAAGMEAVHRFTSEIPEVSLVRYPASGKAEPVPYEGRDPYYEECLHFARCLAGEADPSFLSGTSSREALRIALAAKESVRRGATVPLESGVTRSA